MRGVYSFWHICYAQVGAAQSMSHIEMPWQGGAHGYDSTGLASDVAAAGAFLVIFPVLPDAQRLQGTATLHLGTMASRLALANLIMSETPAPL